MGSQGSALSAAVLWQRERFHPPSSLFCLKNKLGFAAAVGLQICCGFPCQQGHTNPLGAGFVISSVTRGAQGTQVMLPELGTARGDWSPQLSLFLRPHCGTGTS